MYICKHAYMHIIHVCVYVFLALCAVALMYIYMYISCTYILSCPSIPDIDARVYICIYHAHIYYPVVHVF
jgi:hypothetical protein